MRSPPLGVAALLATALAACAPEAPDPGAGSPPPSVTVAPVVRMSLADERERVGRVEAPEDVELRARITGFVEKRLFEEGTDVEAGALLFVIEQAPYEAELQRSEAELARARAAHQEAQLELRRARRLREQGVASQATLDGAIAKEAQTGASVLAAAAQVRQARLDLDYTEVRSPISGRVGRAYFSVGDLVGPESGQLTTVASLDPIWAYWQVPELVLLDFRRAQVERRRRGEEPIQVTARLRFADGSFYEHPGVWDFLNNRVDPTTGTQTARAVFPNPDRLLLPGQYAQVIVQVGAPRETLVIPQSSVQEDQAGRFVLVVDGDDTTVLRRVELGEQEGIYWEVHSGLSEGERVIYQGIQKARPGEKVAPTEARPQQPSGAPADRAPAIRAPIDEGPADLAPSDDGPPDPGADGA